MRTFVYCGIWAILICGSILLGLIIPFFASLWILCAVGFIQLGVWMLYWAGTPRDY